MAINPVQPNIENTKSHIPYREAKGTIKTDKNVKPLPPEGHLVHDSWTMLPKYSLKDIAYDMKAVKDGFQGNANDHQLGRLNDVGLKLAVSELQLCLQQEPKILWLESWNMPVSVHF